MVNKKSMRNIKRKSNKQSKRNLRRSSNKLSRKSVKQQMGGGNPEFLKLLTAAGIKPLEQSIMNDITTARTALQLESIKKNKYGEYIKTLEDFNKVMGNGFPTTAGASAAPARTSAAPARTSVASRSVTVTPTLTSTEKRLAEAKAHKVNLEAETLELENLKLAEQNKQRRAALTPALTATATGRGRPAPSRVDILDPVDGLSS